MTKIEWHSRKFGLNFPILAIVLVSILGCVASAPITNLQPTYLNIEPTNDVVTNPDFQISEYSTFSVVPLSVIDSMSSTDDPLAERQLLFILRNAVEKLGYRFVSDPDSAQMVFTVSASSSYETYQVPPQVRTGYRWIPGSTSTTKTTASGGGFYDGKYGHWSGSGTSTTSTPGRVESYQYTSPGYTTGDYFPSVGIWAYGMKTGEMIWRGYSTGTSDNPNYRIPVQTIIGYLLRGLPACSHADANLPVGTGWAGISISVLTVDGATFYPYVVDKVPGGPADSRGVRREDAILAIDGVSTANKPYSEVIRMLMGEAGSKVALTLWRAKPASVRNAPFDITVKRGVRK